MTSSFCLHVLAFSLNHDKDDQRSAMDARGDSACVGEVYDSDSGTLKRYRVWGVFNQYGFRLLCFLHSKYPWKSTT